MKNYNPKIHHRQSTRLKGYDYSQEGSYFITLNLKDRKCLFGEIVTVDDAVGTSHVRTSHVMSRRQKMILNNIGKIANDCWLEIPKHFPNVILHEYIIMPNHVHGIIELTVGTSYMMSRQNKFSKPIPGSISVIIQQYKSSVTRFVIKSNISYFKWQSRFYERIIRNERAFHNISEYIKNNPNKWQLGHHM